MATATTYYHCAQRTSYQSQHKYEHYQDHDYNPASLQAHTTYYLNTQTFNSRRPYSVPSAPIFNRRSAQEESQDSYYSAASEPSVMAPLSPPPSLGKDNAVCSASHSHHPQLQQHHRQSLQYPPSPHQRQAHLDKDRLPYHPPHQHHSYDERQQFLRPDRSYYQEEHRHSNRASPPSGSSPSLSISSISTASFASSPSPKSLPTTLSSPRVPPSFKAAPQRDTGREDRHLLQEEQLGWNHRPLDHGSNAAAQPHSRPPTKSAVAFMDTHMPMSRTNSSSSAATAVDVVHRPPKMAMDGRGSAKGRRPGPKVNKSVSPQQSKRSPSFRKYLCPEPGCGAPCDSIASLIQHQSKHAGSDTKKGKSKCPWRDCDKVLATPKSLKDHIQIHEERDANLKLPCPIQGCDKVFGTNRCLRAHELRCKQVKSGERLPCPIEGCPYTFGSTDYVRRHVLDHEKGLIGQEFLCDHPGCSAILANPLTLQRHKQLHEEQSLGFEWRCLVRGCGKIYSGSKQLTDHQSRIHKDLDSSYRFRCPYNTCGKTFECQRSAYKHACLHERSIRFPNS
ncbi:hypothetical protein KVV02_007193 [Mortierella alpina]|uniref:C2H2-type domain-containing protein n=1 Tax=Mortierella alpina TaxID=64518 RepID=A0A9P8CXQ1_MORAP|nr:hypothetical protein KVV02_007193 [Mortierella alpina]